MSPHRKHETPSDRAELLAHLIAEHHWPAVHRFTPTTEDLVELHAEYLHDSERISSGATGDRLDELLWPQDQIELAGYSVGDRVRTLEGVKPRKFADQRGSVASLKVRAGEIGVFFGPPAERPAADAWFRPDELELLK